MPIQFFTSSDGIPQLKIKFKAINAAMLGALGKGIIENYLLARTRGRFSPEGTTPTAQKDPDGSRWASPDSATVARRGRGGYNTNKQQALYRTGRLARSIQILRKSTSRSALQSTTGGFFVIGIRKSSPTYGYGRVHQAGLGVPQRRFLGVGKEDIRDINNYLRKALQKGVNA